MKTREQLLSGIQYDILSYIKQSKKETNSMNKNGDIPSGCKKFNVNVAMTGEKCVTRYGRQVHCLTRFNVDGYCLVGIVEGDNALSMWKIDGTCGDAAHYDLFLVAKTKKVTIWINYYPDIGTKFTAHKSELDADSEATNTFCNRAACISVEIEVPE